MSCERGAHTVVMAKTLQHLLFIISFFTNNDYMCASWYGGEGRGSHQHETSPPPKWQRSPL